MVIRSTRAEMGVGTLIIFIAMLLVAAVAAGVLLQTAGGLQQKALSTGQQSKSEISTNARVIEVSATDAAADQAVENFSMQMKLSPGSDPIKLDEATLTFSTDDATTTLVYRAPVNTTHYCGINGISAPQNCTGTSGTTGNYTVEYLINGSNHVEGNLQRGDVVRVHWRSASSLGEDEHLRINFIPKIGAPTLVEFNTPDVMSTQRVYLYP
jgi:archaeal flagellin FlaB